MCHLDINTDELLKQPGMLDEVFKYVTIAAVIKSHCPKANQSAD